MKKLVIVLAIIMIIIVNDYDSTSIIIPTEAIRVRVIANSNDNKDIEEKELLKEEIQPKIYNLLKDVTSIEEARNIIKSNLSNIDVEVKKSLKKQNSNQKYEINYGLNYFPEKNFKGVTYEEGYYESLVITLGEGKGDNWWCVLFPPLCLIEEESSDVEYKSIVMEIIEKYLS